jgi:hypothetical protein
MAVEFGPPFVDKPAAELLGEILTDAGRHADAAAAFRRAEERAEPDCGVTLWLAPPPERRTRGIR